MTEDDTYNALVKRSFDELLLLCRDRGWKFAAVTPTYRVTRNDTLILKSAFMQLHQDDLRGWTVNEFIDLYLTRYPYKF